MRENIFHIFPELNTVSSFNEDRTRAIQTFVLRTNPLSQKLVDGIKAYYEDYAVIYKKENLEYIKKNGISSLYKNQAAPLIIEIGFGNGESFLQMAKNNPMTNYLGFEVYLGGFAECITSAGESGLENVRVMRYDAKYIIENYIEDESVKAFQIYFPDPWPKKRHHKRRLINSEFVSILSKKLLKDGYIHFATDVEDYADEALSVFSKNKELKNKYKDFSPTNENRVSSTFERKGLECGRIIRDIIFVKI